MSRSQHQQMRDAINDVELALCGLDSELTRGGVTAIAEAFEGASDDVRLKIRLGDLRRLATCFPALNRIINDPAFERRTPAPIPHDGEKP